MRPFEFTVDVSHARSVNETLGDVRKLRVSAILAAIAFAAIAAWLFWLSHPWAYILGGVLVIAAVTALWVTLWAPRNIGSVEDLYSSGSLVPAVIAETGTHSVTLLALVDIAKPDVNTPHYALVTRTVRTLPGHSLEVGERVPSITVLNDRPVAATGASWQMVDPMPIAWGTTDLDVIARARALITDGEWELLQTNIALAEKVRNSDDQHLLVDPHDLPKDLR